MVSLIILAIAVRADREKIEPGAQEEPGRPVIGTAGQRLKTA
jgi:hypothetical protein